MPVSRAQLSLCKECIQGTKAITLFVLNFFCLDQRKWNTQASGKMPYGTMMYQEFHKETHEYIWHGWRDCRQLGVEKLGIWEPPIAVDHY